MYKKVHVKHTPNSALKGMSHIHPLREKDLALTPWGAMLLTRARLNLVHLAKRPVGPFSHGQPKPTREGLSQIEMIPLPRSEEERT